MRHVLLLCFSALLFAACGSKKPLQEATGYESEALFLETFVRAVQEHNEEMILQLLDEEYVNEQLHGIFRGDQAKFIGDLFCGYLTNGDNFGCLELAEITEFRHSRSWVEDDLHWVEFTGFDGTQAVICTFTLVQQIVNGEVQYSLYGAVG